MEPIVDTSLVRIQTDPQGANAVASAFFRNAVTVDGVTYESPWTQVSWPILSEETVTLGDLTLSYAQVSAFVTAVAYQVRANANAPAPVTEPTV